MKTRPLQNLPPLPKSARGIEGGFRRRPGIPCELRCAGSRPLTLREGDRSAGFAKVSRKPESRRGEDWRRRADSNRRIEVLQTPALGRLATSPRVLRVYCHSATEANRVGAESGTRTHTPFRALRPQRSLSTNFSIPACPASWFTRPSQGEFWQERQDSNPRPLVLETNALAN